MRNIVIGGLVLGALVVAGCNEKPSGGEATPAASGSATVTAAAASASAMPAAAKPEPEKKAKAEGPKDHKARAKAIEEAFASQDAKKISALYAEDAVIKSMGAPDVKGREAIEKHAQRMFAAFKDGKMTHGRVFEKDKHTVVIESVFTGTNTTDAPEMGIPKATNKPVGFAVVSWYEVGDDGLIKEEHRYHDDPTLLGQLVPDKKNPVRELLTAPHAGTSSYESKSAKDEKEAKDAKEKAELAKAVETEKKNVEVEKKLMSEQNAGKIAEVLKLMAEDIVYVDFTQDKDAKGKKAFDELLHKYLTAFPDLKVKSTAEFAAGDFVVEEFEYTGTHKGPLGGVKATNKPINLHQLEIDEFKDGKFVKSWAWGNNAELYSQIGLGAEEKKGEKKDEKKEEKKGEKK